MLNISLVFTVHQENGACNSIELHNIIEKISPEIIFEELSYSNFDKVYKEKSLVTLESNAIKKYLNNHDIAHIPVDTYNLPNSYYEKLDSMYNKIIHSNKIVESRELRNLLDNQLYLIQRNGFSYLNSDHNDELLTEIIILKDRILKTINDENLLCIANLEKEVTEKREIEIIDNIYKFSKEHKYNNAILFIGSGHRNSIIDQVEKRRIQEKLEINWVTYM
jgi:hypothetical protein